MAERKKLEVWYCRRVGDDGSLNTVPAASRCAGAGKRGCCYHATRRDAAGTVMGKLAMIFIPNLATIPKKFAAADMGKVSRLAKQLLKEHALSPKEVTDAFHIATASVAGMDVLLTWNCRHMANPHSLPLTKKIVRKAGFHCPDVMTPKTFLDNIDLEK